MTLQDLQKQALKLSTSDRWQLLQTLLESLKPKTHPESKKGNLSRLRGIAKSPVAVGDSDLKDVNNVDAIVTRDASGFVGAEIPVMLPEELDNI